MSAKTKTSQEVEPGPGYHLLGNNNLRQPNTNYEQQQSIHLHFQTLLILDLCSFHCFLIWSFPNVLCLVGEDIGPLLCRHQLANADVGKA